ncbi:cupin domain-containing protein [Actinopolyspora mortivallis]|uniref:cupin domain-containing protein n=1 Tax=Actinopolyspora mortivallis TaxID=33906 RepID=UPI001FDF303F|nr:cupin domain-containing protein [Actinopolyspora mortivallis]
MPTTVVDRARTPVNRPAEGVVMQALMSLSFADPTEIREFPHGRLELFDLHGTAAGRFVLEPGWHWFEDVAPLVGTASCQQRHVGYVLTGNLQVSMDNGAHGVIKAGEMLHVEPGHDARVLGNEPVTVLDFADVAAYATTATALHTTP